MTAVTIAKDNPALGIGRSELTFPDSDNLGTGVYKLSIQPNATSRTSLLTSSAFNVPLFAIRVDINAVTREVFVLIGKADETVPNQSIFWLPSSSSLLKSSEVEIAFENWEVVELQIDGSRLRGQALGGQQEQSFSTEILEIAASSEQGTPESDRRLPEDITLYIQGYVRRFNELYSRLAGLGFPAFLYTRPIAASAVFEALDGFLLLFLPSDPGEVRPDILHIVCDTWPLSRLVQAVTVNLIKVLLPSSEPVGADFSNVEKLFRFPEDLSLETIKKAKYHTLSPEVIDVAADQGDRHLVGMAISPITQVRDGILTGVLPTRSHVFSPVVSLPNGQAILQYRWMFADILWEPKGLALDASTAANNAEVDLHLLRLGIETGVPLQSLYQNPHEAVARQLLEVCQEFRELLDEPGTREPDVQAFLEEPSHLFLISPVHQAIYPRKPLGGGKYIPDFTVLKPDSDYHFIEIENPQREIYQASGQEEAAHLNHAIGQVRDWLRYVSDNRDSVRREDGLTTIYEPTGEVIAGRNMHLGEIASRRFDFLRAENRRISLRTYDMLLQDARAYVEVLRSQGGGRVVSGSGT